MATFSFTHILQSVENIVFSVDYLLGSDPDDRVLLDIGGIGGLGGAVMDQLNIDCYIFFFFFPHLNISIDMFMTVYQISKCTENITQSASPRAELTLPSR